MARNVPDLEDFREIRDEVREIKRTVNNINTRLSVLENTNFGARDGQASRKVR